MVGNFLSKVLTIKVFLVAVVILAAGVVLFLYYRGSAFSKDIVSLEIKGPSQVAMGEEIEYTIAYKNNGNFSLENPKITFELPENSLTEDDKRRIEQSLDVISPGGGGSLAFKVRLLGREGDIKTSQAKLSYNPRNLSARYQSEASFVTTINSVPLILQYDELPHELDQGAGISYDINYFSLVDYPLENVSIRLEPVMGFDITSSRPASIDKAEWKLPTMNKENGGKVSLTGRGMFDAPKELAFAAKLGMWRDGTFVVLKEASHMIAVQENRAQLYLKHEINGSNEYVAKAGEVLSYEIVVQNILEQKPVHNIMVQIQLEGSAFDFSTFKSKWGSLNSNHTIVLDGNQVEELREMEDNGKAFLNFTIATKKELPLDSDKTIKTIVTAAGSTREFINEVAVPPAP